MSRGRHSFLIHLSGYIEQECQHVVFVLSLVDSGAIQASQQGCLVWGLLGDWMVYIVCQCAGVCVSFDGNFASFGEHFDGLVQERRNSTGVTAFLH